MQGHRVLGAFTEVPFAVDVFFHIPASQSTDLLAKGPSVVDCNVHLAVVHHHFLTWQRWAFSGQQLPFQSQVVGIQPHQKAGEVEWLPGIVQTSARDDHRSVVKQRRFLRSEQFNVGQHLACAQIHLDHAVLQDHHGHVAPNLKIGGVPHVVKRQEFLVAERRQVDSPQAGWRFIEHPKFILCPAGWSERCCRRYTERCGDGLSKKSFHAPKLPQSRPVPTSI